MYITALTGFVFFTNFHAQFSRFCELAPNNTSKLYSRVAMNPKPTPAAGIKDQAEQVSESAYPMTHYAPVDARGLAPGILATPYPWFSHWTGRRHFLSLYCSESS